MTWQPGDIKDLLKIYIDPNGLDDPDFRYDTNKDGTDENLRPWPQAKTGEWNALWYYLDKAIHNQIHPATERADAVAQTTSTQTGITGTQVVQFDNFIITDASYNRPSAGEIEIDRDGDHGISASIGLYSSGGTSKGRLMLQYSTDNGSTWNDALPGYVHTAEIQTNQSYTVALPTHYESLNGGDRVRILLERQSGSGDNWDISDSWISLDTMD